MEINPTIYSIFLIFTGAAVLATLALYTRQSLLVAYILLGIIIGPRGLELIDDPSIIQQFADFGIIFLLFLMGINLQPQNLLHTLSRATVVTVVSSIAFFVMGISMALLLHFSMVESMVIGTAMIFSSTIISLKLLPTTALHHQHSGELLIGILLLQDLIAIIALLVLKGASSSGGLSLQEVVWIFVALPGILVLAFGLEKYLLRKLLLKFDKIQEYIFLLAIGWCLAIAMLAEVAGLSMIIGAFLAGVSIAASPIAAYISDSLRPLRDFFLILFFFSLGAGLDLGFIPEVLLPAMLFAVVMLLLKPGILELLLVKTKENKKLSREVGLRLGQLSEFSLLLAYLAFETGLIGTRATYTIHTSTIITFIISSYIVVMRYPTPIAVNDNLRRD